MPIRGLVGVSGPLNTSVHLPSPCHDCWQMPYECSSDAPEVLDDDAEPAPRQRGPEDPVHRAKSEVWLASVRSLRRTPQKYARMGPFFLGDVPDAERVFARIASESSDPGLARDSLGGESVVERVAAKPGYRFTQTFYGSELWKLLGPRELAIDELDELANTVIRGFMWTTKSRVADLPWREALRFASGVRLPMSRAEFSRLARRLAKSPSFDALALLCLLHERSLRNGAPDETRLLHGAVLQSTRSFCKRLGLSARTAALFVFLIRRRVLCGRRTLDHSFAILQYADDLLGEWSMLVDSPDERAWLDDEIWRVACALENTWTAQVFEACEDAILALPVECELVYLEEIRRTTVAKRLWKRLEWAQEAALSTGASA
jgi:hypothetical protein